MLTISSVVITLLAGLATARDTGTCSSFCTGLGMMQSSPGKSCDDIYQINKATRGVSGDYWIQTTTGVHQVYCDMELECGGQKGGWMRVANFSASSGDDCPTGWTKITTPTHAVYPSIDVCRSPNDAAGCYPTTFSVSGASYHKICGMARGYQRATPDAFALFTSNGRKGINTPYVDGLSITIGDPRQHVWTYAVGISDDANLNTWACPCARFPGREAHPFIGNHYYCESGATGTQQSVIYTNDPLWDGEGCIDPNNNCCTSPGMPWFIRSFPVSQQADIEVRICRDESYGNEATLVDQLQLYVM